MVEKGYLEKLFESSLTLSILTVKCSLKSLQNLGSNIMYDYRKSADGIPQSSNTTGQND